MPAHSRTAALSLVVSILVLTLSELTLYPQSSVGCSFKRGDANNDEAVNSADASYITNYLFLGGDPPPNFDGADANDSGTLDGSDTSYILNYLFLGGDPPPDPGPTTTGCDPSYDDLMDCCSPASSAQPTITESHGTPFAYDQTPTFQFNYDSNGATPAELSVQSENTDTLESYCDRLQTWTRWTLEFCISDPNHFQPEALEDGCLEIEQIMDMLCALQPNGPCPSGYSQYCKTGTNQLVTAPSLGCLVYTDGQYEYEVNVFGGGGSGCSYEYGQFQSQSCALDGTLDDDTTMGGLTLPTDDFPDTTCVSFTMATYYTVHGWFRVSGGDVSAEELVSSYYDYALLYNW